jgi:hypothetical protein
MGVADTSRHIMVVAQLNKPPEHETAHGLAGVGALLVSRSPFTDADIDEIERVADEMSFDLAATPRQTSSDAFAAVVDGRRIDRFIADTTTADLRPPTDNRPFFFRLDASLLNGLLTFIIVLAVVLIVVPVLVKADAGAILRSPLLSIGFLAIGLGFMLIEIAQMMRLTLLLGHPTFSLSVVLFGMLLSSGAGSYTTSRIADKDLGPATARRLAMLVAVLLVMGAATPAIVELMHTASTPLRIATALVLLTPAGFLMGMAFPLAMTIAAKTQPGLAAWFWGINGAASVTASVVAVAIATSLGIAAAWWAGVTCYVVAALAMTRSARAT